MTNFLTGQKVLRRNDDEVFIVISGPEEINNGDFYYWLKSTKNNKNITVGFQEELIVTGA